jgi:hypothetical protein
MIEYMGAGRFGNACPERSEAMARAARRGVRERRRLTRAQGCAIAVAAATAAAATTTARADLAAAWNFNEGKPVGTIEASAGDGWIDLVDVGGTVDLFSGTVENALGDWRAGDALGLRGTAEGGSLMLFVPVEPSLGEGAYEVSVSFASRRSTTGFAELRLDVWNGGTWTAIETFAVDTDWSVSQTTFDLSHWATTVECRLVPLGATAGSGTFRLDNLVVDVASVPAPGPLALGLAATGIARGRRRNRLVGVARG